jgi:hypothetical protein
MTDKKSWVPVVTAVFATPVCLAGAIASAGAGHGSYFWAKVCFPYSTLSFQGPHPLTAPFMLLAIVQLPFYGVILGLALTRRSVLLWAGVFLLAALHVVFVLMCFGVVSDFGMVR